MCITKYYVKYLIKYVYIGLIALLIVSCSSNADTPIASGINQIIANKIVSNLLNNNIQSKQIQGKDGTITIMVNSKELAKALDIISYNGGIPRNYNSLGDIFKKDSFISSPLEEHERMVYAMQQDVINLLSSIIGVIDVKVSVSIPYDDITKNTDSAPQTNSVAIYIRYRPDTFLINRKAEIKTLISKAVPQLLINNINIYMEPAQFNF